MQNFTTNIFGADVTTEQYLDEESGDYWLSYLINHVEYQSETTLTLNDYNEETEDHESGQIESIQQVSDYLYYSLDDWGKENSGSLAPQCIA